MLRDGIQVSFDNRVLVTLTNNEDSTELQHIINQLPKPIKTIIQDFTFPQDEGERIVQALLQGQLIAACDGSVKGDAATYGYLFTDKDGSFKAKGYGRVPTTGNNPSSQRAEFFGTAAIIIIIKVLHERFKIQQQTSITTYLDNKGVEEYQSAETIKKGLKAHLAKETDINICLKNIIKDINVTFLWKWIKGHQDNNIEEEQLPMEAQMNIEADRMADLGYSLPTSSQQHLPGSKISVYINGQYSSDTNMRRAITNKEHEQPLRDYLQTKYNWDTNNP